MPSATESVRVPAWKRLGLKLKIAQDTPDTPPADSNPKRKRLDVEDEGSWKKSKTTPEPHERLDAAQVTPKVVRKKSVTFTPETKVEDGDSIKQLFTAWKAEQQGQHNLSAPVFQTPQYSVVEENIDPSLDEKERRIKRVKTAKQGKGESADSAAATDSAKPKKKEKKKKETSQSIIKSVEGAPVAIEPSKTKKKKPQPTNSPIPSTQIEKPFLAYLRQYTDSRSTWKFNKNHQTHILKHIFDLDIIPSKYAYYIYEYVKGLQGAGVRIRVRDAALAEKVKDHEEIMEGDEQKKREYDEAMNEYVATMMAAEVGPDVNYEEGVFLGLSDVAMPLRIAKRKRVERVLAELGSGEGETPTFLGEDKQAVVEDDESQKRLRMNDGSSQKVVRKRKQRTAMVDDEDTSSSESSSDSEESSPDDSTMAGDDPDDSSSSSSSSSSSGSEESDSEDGSEESGSEESDSE